ncbi:hypothetical protein Hamer_G011543 [Homarus americanus]|uniref:Secreted protein n=1 Tax=Homarus americanus TaxID=6706 RepID=A0A8J5K1Y5_HOMAM|nr:hypothetical protein Hamer_G011543 [Homarus americanus]
MHKLLDFLLRLEVCLKLAFGIRVVEFTRASCEAAQRVVLPLSLSRKKSDRHAGNGRRTCVGHAIKCEAATPSSSSSTSSSSSSPPSSQLSPLYH